MKLFSGTISHLFIFLISIPSFSQKLVINEVMPANIATVADEDGAYPDWIEIYNNDSTTINLDNFGLSDDELQPLKWKFPEINLPPQRFLLIFASGKNIRTIPAHWETIIDWGDDWKYLVPRSEPPANWRNPAFDDSDWQVGPSGFGYGDNDDATDIGSPNPFEPSPITVLIRRKFFIDQLNQVNSAVLHVDFDDGFLAFLNGVEIARANLGPKGILPTFDQFADAPHEAELYRKGAPDKFPLENISSILREGENVLAMEVHNSELFSSDLTLIPFFTLELKAIPANARGPSPHLQFPTAPRLHTNFKIKSSGETILLSDPTGKLIDKLTTEFLPEGISFGRQPDGSRNWFYFDRPTPEASNRNQGVQAFAPLPQFSLAGGFYQNSISVSITANQPGTIIRYSTDGSLPNDSSAIYDSPLRVNRTTVLRARVFGNNFLPGKTATQTYFIDQTFTLPVISLATNPENFWDDNSGIYVFGNHADTLNYPYWGSNFWQDWERPIHLEFFEPDGRSGFNIDAGVQIFGSWSRLYPQKSLAIFARSNYGYEEIEYPIFPDKPITRFQSIILRNSGQDWGRTFFRDAMMQFLVRDNTNLEIQAYRPAMVFLNGAIWGIHNIREKMSEHYLAAHHGIDPENIDFIERDSLIIKGDLAHYRNMLHFLATHDMRLPENFDYIASQMDVENFMDYTAVVIYFANSDWPWNNVKCWRPKTPQGRWRWLLYDLDYGFHGGHLGPDADVFDEMRHQDNGTTFLFFKLLENETYKNEFINRFADHLNTTFEPGRVIQIINQFKTRLEPEMPIHIARWKNSFEGPWWLGKSIDSMEEWYSHIQVLIDFAERRPDYIRQQLMNEFSLIDGGIGTIHLLVSPNMAGKIKINSQIIKTYPWSGTYFGDVPIHLSALPNPGFRFAHWNGASPADSATIKIAIRDDQKIAAIFESDATTRNAIVINEINYHSSASFDTEDWIELYNCGDDPIDLSHWRFTDADANHRFILPERTLLFPDEYLVLCRDRSAFLKFCPDITNLIGDFNFGLSSAGESIRLYDAQENVIDSVTYGSDTPWPQSSDGQGNTLELIHPKIDNAIPQSWAASEMIGGTPGSSNSVFCAVQNNTNQQPDNFRLFQNHPNPFNSRTAIEFNLIRSVKVSLSVFNLVGEKIRDLADDKFSIGRHQIIWDGSDEKGIKLSSGIYFCQLTTASHRQVIKMILLH